MSMHMGQIAPMSQTSSLLTRLGLVKTAAHHDGPRRRDRLGSG